MKCLTVKVFFIYSKSSAFPSFKSSNIFINNNFPKGKFSQVFLQSNKSLSFSLVKLLPDFLIESFIFLKASSNCSFFFLSNSFAAAIGFSSSLRFILILFFSTFFSAINFRLSSINFSFASFCGFNFSISPSFSFMDSEQRFILLFIFSKSSLFLTKIFLNFL